MAIGKYKGGLSNAFKSISTSKADANLFDFDDVDAAIIDYLSTIVAKLQDSLIEEGNIASGTLQQSIDLTDIEAMNGKYTIAIKYEDYGTEVDEGRKAVGYTIEKRKELQPKIYRWIQNKESLHSIAGDKKKQVSLSYAIATKILKKGTKGSKWLTEVIGKNGITLSNELAQVIEALIGRRVEVNVTKEAQNMLNRKL